MKKILTLLVLGIVCTALLLSGSTIRKEPDHFRAYLLQLVRKCVSYNEAISHKEEIYALLDQIEKKDYVLERGSDDFRVKFVLSQGCIEHVLACSQALGEVVDLIGIIHTPTPTTPLCTFPESVDSSLLDESIRGNAEKLLTVHSRAQIVREYLMKGGTLYVAYPQGGLEKRSPEQQATYLKELETYPNNLFDTVLSTHKIDPDMIGATYLFRSAQGGVYAFSIKARQANDPQQDSEWGLWLGQVKASEIKKRVNTLFAYLKTVKGPQLSVNKAF